MFEVNRETNRISSVATKTFSELNFTERANLQEWIAHEPNALGEELLIIQKEFAGFADTQERLDLLALDKDGNLVIIENKLDDSGRDVVWQALKYASYCSTLNTTEIIEIYQEYLNKSVKQDVIKEASTELCEFFNINALDEINLNLTNRQRIIFIAANFRKEVTSTALWLLGQGINIRCVKVTPYCFGEQTFIHFEQIIPTPETNELIISRSSKESEEKRTDQVRKERYTIRENYWKTVLEAFQQSSCKLFNNINPTKDHWLSAGSGVSACIYQLIFGKNEIRVCLYFDKTDAADNKYIFDCMESEKTSIEETFGESLEWLRLDDKKSSRIQFSCSVSGYDKDQWQNFVNWHIENMTKLENATKGYLQKIGQRLKQRAS